MDHHAGGLTNLLGKEVGYVVVSCKPTQLSIDKLNSKADQKTQKSQVVTDTVIH